MSTLIRFTKMHGLGNDFIVINGVTQNIKLSSDQVRFIADRRRGVGCDQILIVEKSNEPNIDFYYKIYNADGSEVGQCGNGARCLAKFIHEEKLSDKKNLRVKTQTRILNILIENDFICVDMGEPHAIEKYPEGISLDLGNPHVVFCVNNIDVNLDNRGLHDKNVGFVQVIDRAHIKIRVFERGVGETSACGSGACAAVVAGITQGLLDESVTVSLTGGELFIQWKGPSHPVYMTGPAETVFKGEILVK